MAFNYYTDIERAKAHGRIDNTVLAEIMDFGAPGDLFHLAHAVGKHRAGIVDHVIDIADDEALANPAYCHALPFLCADFEMEDYQWEAIVDIFGDLDDDKAVAYNLGTCLQYGDTALKHNRSLTPVLFKALERLDCAWVGSVIELACEAHEESVLNLDEIQARMADYARTMIEAPLDELRTFVIFCYRFDFLQPESAKPLVQRLFYEGDIEDKTFVHGCYGILVDESPIDHIMAMGDKPDIEAWSNYWKVLTEILDATPDDERAMGELTKLKDTLIHHYPSTDLVLFMMAVQDTAAPPMWHDMTARILEQEAGNTEMLWPLFESLKALLADMLNDGDASAAQRVAARLHAVVSSITGAGMGGLNQVQLQELSLAEKALRVHRLSA
jgi:hypothetical protein